MASKRNLYRPAPQENVGQQRARKRLVQGRLITGSNSVPGSVPVTGHDDSKSSVQAPPRIPYANNQSYDSQVSQLGRQVTPKGKGFLQGSGEESILNQSSRTEDYVLNPRSSAPHVTEYRSPKQGIPAQSLDLSECEPDNDENSWIEKSPGSRTRYQKPSEVLCIDASRQTKDPDLSEVDIVVGVKQSPVKIVCHSPSSVKRNLRKMVQSGQAQRVDVDTLPTVSFMGEPSPVRKTKHASHVEMIEGGEIDPYTAVQSIPMSPSSSGEEGGDIQDMHIPQPNFDEVSMLFGLPDLPRREVRDTDTDSVLSVDSNACSIDEYVTSNPKSKKIAPVPRSTKKVPPAKAPDMARAKKGRVVPSRYMQAVESKAKSSSLNLDQTSMRVNKPSKSLEKPQSARKVARKNHHPIVSAPSDEKDRPRTPETLTVANASTPTSDCSLPDHDIDASAIHPDLSVLSNASNFSKLHLSMSTSKQKPMSEGREPLQEINTNRKKSKGKVTQVQLDLRYGHYLQWLFLYTKGKKCQQEQEKQAMTQIAALHEEVEKMRKVKAERLQHLAQLRHLNMLDELIDIQRQGLGPVVANLPQLQKNYSDLAHALDTTRHQIRTKGVYIPDNEEEFLGTLETALAESEHLLGQISVLSRQKSPKVTAMATGLETLEKDVENMTQELKRSQELILATEKLHMEENSLKVQAIQDHWA
ncbi:hypothetical protein ACJMK2_006077 [Sinanodonta woodiana]|uniref:HAUS augmin-like complex subunit 8 n=1 Tax=Sinanodonta woodiana TaxID=1069815 RepID=A0ABD3VSR8_SINWO